MERKISGRKLLVRSTRFDRLGWAFPSVTRRSVLPKPASSIRWSISLARRKLKSNSAAPRALRAPIASGVWPTSITARNWARSQLGAGVGMAAFGGGTAAFADGMTWLDAVVGVAITAAAATSAAR